LNLIAGFEFCQDYAEAGSSKRCIFNEGSPFHIVKIEVLEGDVLS